MKVIHLTTSDEGGAARAAQRISDVLINEGIDSEVLTWQTPQNGKAHILDVGSKKHFINKICILINNSIVNKYKKRSLFHTDKYGIDFMKINKLKEADIIHIHWVNEGIWSHTFANKLNKVNKPIVWTIHDMWTFTGGCHYTEKCDLYYYGCGKCPILNSKRKRDISFKESKWKKGWIRKANIRFVGCSNWITNEFNKSEIGKSGSKEAICIPNPAERKSFCCLDRIACKEILKINTKKKIILFGAMSAISDKRKGFEQLVGAIKELSNEQYAVAIFGNDCDDYKNIKEKINEYEVIDFGIIKNDISLSMIYNIADVFIAPSLQENLANTVMESLLCGTPVVAFDIGGMSDMIINKINGYLATPFDKKDLAKGIEYVCKDNEDKIDRLKISEETNRRFNVETISKRYIKVYNELLSRV